MRSATVALLTCLLPCWSACEAAPAPTGSGIEVVDADGRVVRLARPAQRIVSLVPAQTDAVIALGAADRLLARTRFDADPAIARLPVIDDALTPSVEWLAEQRPDLVFAWPDRLSRSVVTRIVELGIPVYASASESLDDVRRGLRDLGVLLGLEAAAEALVAGLDATIDSVRASHSGQSRPRVLYLIGLDPPMAAGPGSFVHELIDIAGGVNVLGDAAGLWPPVSLEEILVREPDVIVIAVERQDGPALLQRLRERPGWRSLAAVRTGRVHIVDAGLFNRPGPSLVLAMRALAAALRATGSP